MRRYTGYYTRGIWEKNIFERKTDPRVVPYGRFTLFIIFTNLDLTVFCLKISNGTLDELLYLFVSRTPLIFCNIAELLEQHSVNSQSIPEKLIVHFTPHKKVL